MAERAARAGRCVAALERARRCAGTYREALAQRKECAGGPGTRRRSEKNAPGRLGTFRRIETNARALLGRSGAQKRMHGRSRQAPALRKECPQAFRDVPAHRDECPGVPGAFRCAEKNAQALPTRSRARQTMPLGPGRARARSFRYTGPANRPRHTEDRGAAALRRRGRLGCCPRWGGRSALRSGPGASSPCCRPRCSGAAPGRSS